MKDGCGGGEFCLEFGQSCDKLRKIRVLTVTAMKAICLLAGCSLN